MRIEIVSSSARKEGITIRLAKHLKMAFEKHEAHSVNIIDLSAHDLPLMQRVLGSADDASEKNRHLAERIFKADGFIIVTPEYNGTFSPAMQNMFDHFPKQHHKVFGLVSASPGALGGIRAAMQLQQFVLALFGIVSPYMLVTPQVDKKFDEEGNLLDHGFQKPIDLFINEYLWLGTKISEEKATA